MTTNSHHIAHKITGCGEKITSFVLKYSINAAITVCFTKLKSTKGDNADVKMLI